MLEVLEKLQFSVSPLTQDWSAERLHDLFYCNRLVRKLVLRGATGNLPINTFISHGPPR